MSKTIGNMTLKASPVGTDMVAIADSEDSDKTKKVLLSAISGGGGASKVHLVDNVTVTSGVYSGTSGGVTQYEDGHIYIIKAPSTQVTASTRYININSLGNKPLEFNYYSGFSDNSFPGNGLPGQPYLTVVIYNGYDQVFYLLDNTRSSIKTFLWGYYIHGVDIICGSGTSEHAPVKQYSRNVSGSSVSINFDQNYNYRHSIINCTSALTSLTLSNVMVSSTWEKEVHFTTDSTFTFTATELVGKWIGGAPTFEPNKSYVIAIKNGLAVCGEVS